MVETLLQIIGDGFACGLVARDGRVIEAAPRIRYMRGWTGRRVAEHCRQKGWRWEIVHRITPGTAPSRADDI